MQYIVYRRFKGKCLGGYVNLPRGTVCESIVTPLGESILLNGREIVRTTSEDAHQYFARNDDGRGLARGDRVQEILKLLRKPELPSDFYKEKPERRIQYQNAVKKNYDARWAKIWGDLGLLKFKRKEHKDFWIWNHEFYNATIEELNHILNIITEV